MKRYMLYNSELDLYKQKARWNNDDSYIHWVIKDKADIYKTTSAAKLAGYMFSINPNKQKLGAKIILPAYIEIVEIEI